MTLLQPGVVDQHVKPSPALFGVGGHLAGFGVDRDVCLTGFRFTALFPDPGDDFLSRVFRGPVIHQNLGPLGGKSFSNCAAHPCTGSGDDRDLVFEFHTVSDFG